MLQIIAVPEHPVHNGHLAGVQVLQADDGVNFIHPIKPSIGCRWAGTGERGVNDRIGHLATGMVQFPTDSVESHVQVIDPARAGIALVIVVERQRRVLGRVADIGHGACTQVAWVTRATVDVGIVGIHMGGVIGRTPASHETGAVLEHIMRASESHLTHFPAIAHVDGLQSTAAPEHLAQVGHLRDVEFFQIQARQLIAAVEHVIHACHLAGVQVLQTCNGFKVPHSGEPVEGADRAGTGKRGVKDHLLHIEISEIGNPTGIDGTIV